MIECGIIIYMLWEIIFSLCFVFRIIDAKSRPSLVEKIFLTVGMLCFFAMGKSTENYCCSTIINTVLRKFSDIVEPIATLHCQ